MLYTAALNPGDRLAPAHHSPRWPHMSNEYVKKKDKRIPTAMYSGTYLDFCTSVALFTCMIAPYTPMRRHAFYYVLLWLYPLAGALP